jgi:hypothetical protein
MTTADDSVAIVTYTLDGSYETIEAGTTTTDDEAQVVGKAIETGTETYDETATVTTIVLGTVKTTLDGIEDGTSDEAKIATDGDEAETIKTELGKYETNEKATTTGDEIELGIVTAVGTETNDETGTETTAVLGMVKTTLDGTEAGTSDEAIMATDGEVDEIITTELGNDETNE